MTLSHTLTYTHRYYNTYHLFYFLHTQSILVVFPKDNPKHRVELHSLKQSVLSKPQKRVCV
jgi:hypothetical protein